jgi:hypothetical protein
MYWRKGRLSFYIGRCLFWLRIRTKEGLARGFLFRIGQEGP